MTLQIFYGIKEHRIDVTSICLEKMTTNNIITIPSGDDMRIFYFSDPLAGTDKYIYVIINDCEYEYDVWRIIKIDLIQSTSIIVEYEMREDVDIKINEFHSKLKIIHGDFHDELPEQKMVVRYFTGNEKVLELGGNIGRNSLVIGSLVNNSSFVSMESDKNIANQLRENRDLNNMSFHIEHAALSKRKLIQYGWETTPMDNNLEYEEGCFQVDTITYDELKQKYNIDFNTLVLDCEGAFYYILMDMPEMLNDIQLIIMENDYYDINHKIYVDTVLKQYGFYNDYTESGGWGDCFYQFFEVWKKK
jgi:FkbM family methyltransferase